MQPRCQRYRGGLHPHVADVVRGDGQPSGGSAGDVDVIRDLEQVGGGLERGVAVAYDHDGLTDEVLGVDGHVDDPVGNLALETDDFCEIGKQIADLELPTAFVLEGGYSMHKLANTTVNFLRAYVKG
mgnify:CR=1 FL=1